ncbi:hypothetical protein Pmar_PMAR018787 [Perkinsus marinus ATCC 50983]|uniref:Uncharacterized protein n=1 Tax=Perkinsus marinus (strain ATCC 50983 / TXsc) TaxID=423536 RepID=C5KJD3_PERM5|nr:hypothetical protein Pmar_PMAR018787 [Perkinsus marinus ATCC 50983]EER15435.1 hypothetical protein Pmar_PMAR018787 [Perkinsus marinus ATCC 50983]|eukprot:XP_002783639.1 hypothetical protein Pmar_PMAR018787 [Perkinsus marinus ATCC 50983]
MPTSEAASMDEGRWDDGFSWEVDRRLVRESKTCLTIRSGTEPLGAYDSVAPVEEWERIPKYRTRSEMFSFGHDQAGSKRPFAVQQRRGKIVTQGNCFELDKTNSAHLLDEKDPPSVRTRTDLELARRTEMKNTASKLFNQWEKDHPMRIPEGAPSSDNHIAQPKITHIGQRATADHQASRVCAGLMPVNTAVNPERESKTLSLQWVDEPAVRTRSQLMEVRREGLKRDLDECRNRGEAEFVPLSVRQTAKEAAAYEYRKDVGEAKTKTGLDLQRRRERIELNLASCRQEKPRIPAFSDHDEPWWTLGGNYTGRPRGVSSSNTQDRGRSIKSRVTEATFKITESVPERPPQALRPARRDPPLIGDVKPKSTEPLFPEYSCVSSRAASVKSLLRGRSRTVTRWTTEIIEHGALRNGKRLFDSLQPSPVYVKDFAPLEVYSSFDIIRRDALKKQAMARSDGVSAVSKLASIALSQRSGAAVSGEVGLNHYSCSLMGLRPAVIDQERRSGDLPPCKIAKTGPKMSVPCGDV